MEVLVYVESARSGRIHRRSWSSRTGTEPQIPRIGDVERSPTQTGLQEADAMKPADSAVARPTPPEASPALTVLAYYAWVNGKGTIASLALDRALAAQPDYALARLLDRMVSMGIRLR